MIIKNNKILKVSAIATILSIGLLSAGYTLANKNITLVVKGKETEISTLKSNVEDVLAEQNVKYDKNDIISLPLDQKISDGDKIEVIKVTEKTIKENKEVPFEVNIVEDKNLLKGDTKVEVEGQPGNNELLYKITYHNGKQVEKKFIEEVVVTKPVDKVIKKGTKVELQVAHREVRVQELNILLIVITHQRVIHQVLIQIESIFLLLQQHILVTLQHQQEQRLSGEL